MDGLIGQSDGLIRLAVFAGVFVLMALVELLWPKRKLIVSKKRRWLTNIGISVAGTVLLRLMAIARRAGRGHRRRDLCRAAPNRAAEPSLLASMAQSGGGALGARPRHLGAAFGLAQDPAVLAPAPGAPRRPRHRRDHGGALSPGGDRALHAVEDRGGGAAWRFAFRGVPVRGDPQRLRHVQSRQYRAARLVRPGVAPLHRHARHAPRAPLGAAARARLQLRLQSLAVGPAVPDLHRAARGRASRHDHRAYRPIRAKRQRGSAGRCGCRSDVRRKRGTGIRRAANPARKSSWGSSAGTAPRSARSHAPARARS